MIKLKNKHPIVRVNYIPRLFGQLFVCVTVFLSLNGTHNTNHFFYTWLVFQGLIWPQLVMLISYNLKNPKGFELAMLLCDSTLLGFVSSFIGFELWPTSIFLNLITVGNLSVRGVRFGLVGILFFILGGFISALLFGFTFKPHSNLPTALFSLCGLTLYSCISGYTTFYQAKVSRQRRSEIRVAIAELDDINKILKISGSFLKLNEIMNLFIELLKDKIISFQTVTLHVLDPQTNKLKLRAIIDNQLSDKEKENLISLNYDDSLFMCVADSKLPLYYENINNHPLSLTDENVASALKFNSTAIFPLFIKNKIIGVIGFYHNKPFFTNEGEQLKKIVKYINYISLVLNNALLYEVLDKRRDEIATKNQQLSMLSSQLSKYIPLQLFKKIIAADEEEQITVAHNKTLTVFFTDLVGFSTLTDTLTSNQLTSLLKIFLESMTTIALKFGGTIDKFMGDGLMIFFGETDDSNPKQDAKKCIKMALKMREVLLTLNSTWNELKIPTPISARVGINSGVCAVGNFGCDFKMNYTSIGSAVNLASRLEHIAKPGEIIISEFTYQLVSEFFIVDKLGPIHVKGLTNPIEHYQVIGEK